MRVLLDTNVVLDSLLARAPWNAESDEILRAADRGDAVCAFTTLSIANLFYVGRRLVGLVQARNEVRVCLQRFDVVGVGRQTLLNADAMPGTDFEDNIQISAAVQSAVDGLVTRDSSGLSHSPLPVWTPAEFLQQLSSQGP